MTYSSDSNDSYYESKNINYQKKKLSNKERQQRHRLKRKQDLRKSYGLKKKKTSFDEHENIRKNSDSNSEFIAENCDEQKITDEVKVNDLNISILSIERFSDFNSSEISSDEEYKFDKEGCAIYTGSKITKKEFCMLFESVCDKIAISESNREINYKFIQMILPPDSNIPSSYYMLKKSICSFKVNCGMLCPYCKNRIEEFLNERKKKVKTCLNENCLSYKSKLRSSQTVKIYTNSLSSQLKIILDNHYDKISAYQSSLKIKNGNFYFDISSGHGFTYDYNAISLILFTDGVQYNKSGQNSMWVILAAIAELPPLLRNSFENILFLSSWTGSTPDFNLWLSYEKEINELIMNGLEWNNRIIKIRILALIADAPARAKACNCVQFNGYYGCIKCLHPGETHNKTLVYPNMSNIRLRSNKMYQQQVEKVLKDGVHFEGVKGFCHLSYWIDIPDDVIYDYMHMCLLGTFRKMFNSFFDSINWKEIFYLKKVIHFVNNRLLSVKLPLEIKRKTREIEERFHYKANEFRTISLYLSFGLFKGLLNDIFLNNLMKYVIFLRLLCQKRITDEEIEDSEKIIIDFMIEFEKLYGKRAMTSNLHGHLHLPRQVKRFGPLNKTSCFPFENVFKNTRNLFHGTRNFEGQIALNIEKRRFIRQSIKEMAKKTQNSELRFFIKKNILIKNSYYEENSLLNSFTVSLSDFSIKESSLIIEFLSDYLSDSSKETLLCSKRALVSGSEYHTYDYDQKFDSTDSHSIEYRVPNQIEKRLGKIIKFFEIKGLKFCMVRNYIQKDKDMFFNQLSVECAKYIDRFFQVVELTENYFMLDLLNIERRCISIDCGSEIVISILDDLEEMD